MSPSIWQIGIVVLIILLLFGPKRIPGLGRSIGEAIGSFKKGLAQNDETKTTANNTTKKANTKTRT